MFSNAYQAIPSNNNRVVDVEMPVRDRPSIRLNHIGNGEGDADRATIWTKAKASKILVYLVGTFICVGLFFLIRIKITHVRHSSPPIDSLSDPPSLLFDSVGRFVMKDYDVLKPVANFLNG